MTDHQLYTKKMKLPWRIIDDEAVIVDLQGNSVLQLNDVGRHIWERINGVSCISGIVDSIIESYDVDRDAARNDALRFIDTLVEKGLIHALPSETECSGPSL